MAYPVLESKSDDGHAELSWCICGAPYFLDLFFSRYLTPHAKEDGGFQPYIILLDAWELVLYAVWKFRRKL